MISQKYLLNDCVVTQGKVTWFPKTIHPARSGELFIPLGLQESKTTQPKHCQRLKTWRSGEAAGTSIPGSAPQHGGKPRHHNVSQHTDPTQGRRDRGKKVIEMGKMLF